MTEATTLTIYGTMQFPDGQWRRGQLSIADEKIIGLREASGSEGAEAATGTGQHQVHDFGTAYVLPGAVDAHVHSLSHENEGISASTSSAAAGGVTTIIEMPFDYSGPINNIDRLRAKQDLANAEAHVDVALLGTIDPNGGWKHAEQLAREGAVGFKASMFDTDAFRFPRTSDRQLLNVLAATRDVGRTLCVHAENNEIIQGGLEAERAAGNTDPQSHSRSRPPVSETLGVLTAMEIAAESGSKLHLCHLSLPRSVDLVRWYREQGADITLETCPHYLTFTSEDLDGQRGRLKINPPLRSAADRTGLWERLASGDVPVITSDHAPWPIAKKIQDVMLDNSSGAPGVQNVVPFTLGQALRRDPSLALFDRAVKALSLAPAQRYGLDHRKGSLAAGKDADIMVFDAQSDAVVELDAQLSNAGWTPYEGLRPGGQVTHTFVRGRLAYSAEQGLLAEKGKGELVTCRED